MSGCCSHKSKPAARSNAAKHASGRSDESKSKSGGKRPGAGRKPNLAKRLLKGFTSEAIALAIQDMDVGAVIVGLPKSNSARGTVADIALSKLSVSGSAYKPQD